MISRGVRMRLCGFRHSPTGRASRPFLAQGPYRRAERRPGKQRTPGPRPLSAVSGKLTSTRCSDGDGGRVAGAARLARPSLRCSCVPRGRAPCSKDREQGMTRVARRKVMDNKVAGHAALLAMSAPGRFLRAQRQRYFTEFSSSAEFLFPLRMYIQFWRFLLHRSVEPGPSSRRVGAVADGYLARIPACINASMQQCISCLPH